MPSWKQLSLPLLLTQVVCAAAQKRVPRVSTIQAHNPVPGCEVGLCVVPLTEGPEWQPMVARLMGKLEEKKTLGVERFYLLCYPAQTTDQKGGKS